jgi:hypothetical protein
VRAVLFFRRLGDEPGLDPIVVDGEGEPARSTRRVNRGQAHAIGARFVLDAAPELGRRRIGWTKKRTVAVARLLRRPHGQLTEPNTSSASVKVLED